VNHLKPYSEEWRNHPSSYARRVVTVLGDEVTGWWEGPCDPRTVTIRLSGDDALVWDEESGWRLGAFVSGDETSCTELIGARYLCGGLLLRPERVPPALADARRGVGNSTAWRPCYRDYRNYRDGFDVALDQYVEPAHT
jgi:hypothetical protein